MHDDIEDLNPEKISIKIDKYEQVVKMRDEILSVISQNELIVEKNEGNINILHMEIDKLGEKINEYEENREAIENLGDLLEQKVENENILKSQQIILGDCDEKIINLPSICQKWCDNFVHLLLILGIDY